MHLIWTTDVIPKSSTRPILSSSTVADGNDWVSTDESSIRGVPMNHNTALIASLSVSLVLVLILLLVVGLLLFVRFKRWGRTVVCVANLQSKRPWEFAKWTIKSYGILIVQYTREPALLKAQQITYIFSFHEFYILQKTERGAVVWGPNYSTFWR